MHAEVNYWSVTLYAPNRSIEHVKMLRFLVEVMRDNYVAVGSAGIGWLSYLPRKNNIEKPYVWFPHRNEAEVREFLEWADLDVSNIPFITLAD